MKIIPFDPNSAKMLVTAANTVAKNIGVLRKVSEFFKPFKYSTKMVEINYRTKKMRLELIVETPTETRKIKRRIEIPKLQGLSFGSVQNEFFQEIPNPWLERDNKWLLPIKNLKGDRFLIELMGNVSAPELQKLIKVYSSANRDFSDNNDKYLLTAYIRNIEFFEKSYRELTIEGVPFQVKVELKRAVSTIIPKSMQARYAALNSLANAAVNFERGKLFRAGLKYRAVERKGWDYSSIQEFLTTVGDIDFFKKHLDISGDFQFGQIKKGRMKDDEIIPKTINVKTETKLTLKQPTSNGELIFRRKDFQKSLKDAIL